MNRFYSAARVIVLGLFSLIALLPIYWMVLSAFRSNRVVMQWPPNIWPSPSGFSLEAMQALFTGTPVLSWLGMSAIIAIGTTLLTVSIATLAGYALSRSRSRLTGIAGYVILIAKMLPGTLLIIPLYIMFFQAGLLKGPQSSIAVILANCSFAAPFATWMMKAYFDGIPKEIEEAAMIDGCGPLGAMLKTILPAAAPALAAVTIYVFIVAWNDFMFARTFLPGGEVMTISAASTQFLGEVEMAWNKVMAVAVLAAAPVFIVFLLLERHFSSGLTGGHH
ncbi:carbohydrate ABC transporter permease [Falsochrobactrum shanghaiense]|uniref:Carbohydrate ABC transporter permease n=1 Tax=Falsochrobactrum shanghaiense TaxID=2201899 RepID=A0A316JGE5_9HYPH|nr:carbohydrate ABC transporter permease [Falsochrobactrum shanghaiense]PWL18303.1 carbohydrate ABC transporter permease [Falsochrobactrum shanghaiense]